MGFILVSLSGAPVTDSAPVDEVYHSSIQQRLNVSCIMLKKCPERFRALFE
jgi:hypothetical protein